MLPADTDDARNPGTLTQAVLDGGTGHAGRGAAVRSTNCQAQLGLE
jgi:hypothetical protein